MLRVLRVEAGEVTFAAFVRALPAGAWRRQRASTLRRAESALRTQLIPAFGGMSLEDVSPKQVEEWFAGYSRAAPGGANRVLDVLQSVFGAAIRAGILERNPAAGVIRNRRPRVTRFLSRSEIARVHECLDTHVGRGPGASQQADVIRLLLLTGCRRSEITSLRWSEIDGSVLRLRDGKTGGRTVWLSGDARAVLERQQRNGSPFVFGGAGGPRSPELSLWRKVRRVAGLEDVRLHDLRHTFASQAVLAGVSLPVVSRLLGHRSIRMTLRYAHVGDKDVEAAAERIGLSLAASLEGRG